MKVILVPQIIDFTCVFIYKKILPLLLIELTHIDLLKHPLLVKRVQVILIRVDEQVDHVWIVHELTEIIACTSMISVDLGETGVGRAQLRILHPHVGA